jgi:hypothetical protein
MARDVNPLVLLEKLWELPDLLEVLLPQNLLDQDIQKLQDPGSNVRGHLP